MRGLGKTPYIRDENTKKEFTITDCSGFPFEPDSYQFTRSDEKVKVTMVFPSLPTCTKTIDIIDDVENPEGFNFLEFQ